MHYRSIGLYYQRSKIRSLNGIMPAKSAIITVGKLHPLSEIFNRFSKYLYAISRMAEH